MGVQITYATGGEPGEVVILDRENMQEICEVETRKTMDQKIEIIV